MVGPVVSTAERIPVVTVTRRPPTWLLLMILGFVMWAGLFVRGMMLGAAAHEEGLTTTGLIIAGLELITGLLIIQGACEALVQSVERLALLWRHAQSIEGQTGVSRVRAAARPFPQPRSHAPASLENWNSPK